MARYTPKQIEKYNRQKYITFLEKITKNLFKMLRNETTTAEIFKDKFHQLITKLNELETTRLDSEYLQEIKSYIDRLYNQTIELDEERLEEIRSAELGNLNRLQKLKKRVSYKKDKHKHESKNQDWG